MLRNYTFIIWLISFGAYAQGFDTPYHWIGEAKKSVQSGDTGKAYINLGKAVKAGLYDSDAVQTSALLPLLQTSQGKRLVSEIQANRRRISSPEAIKIHTDDITRFWSHYPQLEAPGADSIFFRQYIKNGTTGLKTFYSIRMQNSIAGFVTRVRERKLYYESIRKVSLGFKELDRQIRKSAVKLEALYPESIFPPVYFIMGSLNNVGTADGYSGMILGVEHLCLHEHADTSQLQPAERHVLFETSQALPIVVHEYVHLQQKNGLPQTLLDYAISEGAADFICYLVTGNKTDPKVYEYGTANESQLWKEFSQAMNGADTDSWLFNTLDEKTGRLGNLGYFIGFRICESYYNKAKDKKQAIKDMLEVRDYPQFLKDSGYGKQ